MNLWATAKRILSREDAIAQQRQLADDYRHVFGSEPGQRVLADLLRRSGITREPMVPGDPHATAFNLGRISMGRELVRAANSDPGAADHLVQTGEIGALIHG